MSHISMILSGLILMTMVLFFAPNIFAINHGRILRNIALWLTIFLGLSLVYKNFGPDSPHPLFQLPDAMSGMRGEHGTQKEALVPAKDDSDAGENGFMPPKE